MATLTVTSPAGEQFTAEYKLLYLWAGEPHFADLSKSRSPIPSFGGPTATPRRPAAGAAQPLYDVEVTLSQGKTVLDQRSYKIGLRTVELRQEPDAWGKEFTFSSTACACSPRAPTGFPPTPSPPASPPATWRC